MRAAYTALALGILAGSVIATGVLSGRADAPPTTVAGALAIDHPPVDLDRRRAEAVAVLTARCMLEHGFAWVPWVEPRPELPDPDLGPVEWATRWGFGVSTMAERAPVVAPTDPNLEIASALGPDDRDALRNALHGGRGRPGCQATANAEVFGSRDRLLASLRPPLIALDARIAADPAAVAVLETWRGCVRPAADGFALERHTLPAALIGHFSRRLAALGRTPLTVAGLAAIQADERRVATLLARCEEAFVGGRAAAAAPHEAAFVREHRTELERIGEAIRSAEAALPTLPP